MSGGATHDVAMGGAIGSSSLGLYYFTNANDPDVVARKRPGADTWEVRVRCLDDPDRALVVAVFLSQSDANMFLKAKGGVR